MNVFDEVVAANVSFAATPPPRLDAVPSRRLAVVTCMDARIDVFAALGLHDGEAHILRNAGGVVTKDMIRSLSISQRLLGTTAVAVIGHTDCGMTKTTDEQFAAAVASEVGTEPPWPALTFPDVEARVRESVDTLRADPFLPHRDAIRGFVYDVDTGQLRTVT
ncbi:MAG: beta-class carbonic anhydrase [Jatrophihabitans sp.]